MSQLDIESATSTPPDSNTSLRSILDFLKRNLNHFKTTKGVLKLAEFLLGVLCGFLASPIYPTGTLFRFIVFTALVGTTIWIILYIAIGSDILTSVMCWVIAERIFTGIACIDYALASLIQTLDSTNESRVLDMIAGLFGFINTFLYGIGVFLVNSAHFDLMYSLS
ncbi:uncharacterized protein LOC123011828 [Tribolium madens]|uniref:uncharacterized protein LOC123011828 n=1 Tax=Tribolium madens TaxID=41895 RepID=UPI001CF736BE|nr:uncharacterized protein LOC123011828 [Tribolium madens]